MPVDFWLVIIGGGLCTILLRLGFFLLAGRWEPPLVFQRALRYAPVAVFSAMIVPAFLAPQGSVDFSLNNYHLLAGLVAAIVAWRTRNLLWTLLAGIAVYWGLLYLIH